MLVVVSIEPKLPRWIASFKIVCQIGKPIESRAEVDHDAIVWLPKVGQSEGIEARRDVVDLRALSVLRHHPARACPGRRSSRGRVSRREIERERTRTGITAGCGEAAALTAGIETAPRLPRDIVEALAARRAVARKDGAQSRGRKTAGERIRRAKHGVVRLQALRLVRPFGGDQVTRRELIGIDQASAVAMLEDFIIRR